VQRAANYCYDRAATVSQISYRMILQPAGQRSVIVFGGFENFCTGTRSIVQIKTIVIIIPKIAYSFFETVSQPSIVLMCY
jgi:hypothetical protein